MDIINEQKKFKNINYNYFNNLKEAYYKNKIFEIFNILKKIKILYIMKKL